MLLVVVNAGTFVLGLGIGQLFVFLLVVLFGGGVSSLLVCYICLLCLSDHG